MDLDSPGRAPYRRMRGFADARRWARAGASIHVLARWAGAGTGAEYDRGALLAVLVLAVPASVRAQAPAGRDWIGKRVVQKTRNFTLLDEAGRLAARSPGLRLHSSRGWTAGCG